MECPSSPCLYTPPDALGTSTGDSISIHPNTIHADAPRPSMNDNISTSVNSVDDAAQRNESIASQLLTIGKLTASVLQNLSQQETVVAQATLSAMFSAAGDESKNAPLDLATSPSSSDQDKSSWVMGPVSMC